MATTVMAACGGSMSTDASTDAVRGHQWTGTLTGGAGTLNHDLAVTGAMATGTGRGSGGTPGTISMTRQ